MVRIEYRTGLTNLDLWLGDSMGPFRYTDTDVRIVGECGRRLTLNPKP